MVDAQVNGDEMIAFKSAVADVLRNSGADEPLPQVLLSGFPPVQPDLSALDVDKIVKWNPFGYKVTKVNAFLAHVYYYLVGQDDAADVGYISFMLPEMLEEEAQEHVTLLHERIKEAYDAFLARKRKEVLAAVLPDPKSAERETDALDKLYADLKRIYATTENAMKL
jgi:hypothetical protein